MWNTAKKFIFNPLRLLIIIALIIILEFGVALFAADYYIHTEIFYDSVNPDILMGKHGYLWQCDNSTAMHIPELNETRQLCGWQKWVRVE